VQHPLVTMAPASQQQSALTVAVWPVGHVLMAMASAVSVSHHTSYVANWRCRATVVVSLCVYVCEAWVSLHLPRVHSAPDTR
jgi:hypothetical protein